jgi:hypothetical protein
MFSTRNSIACRCVLGASRQRAFRFSPRFAPGPLERSGDRRRRLQLVGAGRRSQAKRESSEPGEDDAADHEAPFVRMRRDCQAPGSSPPHGRGLLVGARPRRGHNLTLPRESVDGGGKQPLRLVEVPVYGSCALISLDLLRLGARDRSSGRDRGVNCSAGHEQRYLRGSHGADLARGASRLRRMPRGGPSTAMAIWSSSAGGTSRSGRWSTSRSHSISSSTYMRWPLDIPDQNLHSLGRSM